jgi:subtilisin family serine protease
MVKFKIISNPLGILGDGIKVLVIDSGVNTQHPDLQDIIPVNKNVEEDVHGTHVTGIITGNINHQGKHFKFPNS